jgi:iron complex outermembrane receptor protein
MTIRKKALWLRGCVAVLTLGSAASLCRAEASTQPASDDLTSLSLDELMNVEVSSVTKHKIRIADAPAAITVIGQEDIRRSGHSSIPELLRMVPGLDVARFNASTWAVSSRGFNSVYSEKLLVLQDGRTLYSPLFSGVYWDAQDTILEDLDRIEVIRGPGSTIWGANAVNGVINITTKSARDTQGGLFIGRTGSDEHIGAVRYGGKIDDNTFYRVYAKYRTHDDLALADGSDDHDGYDSQRAGFRIDRHATNDDQVTLSGEIYSSTIGQVVSLPVASPPFTTLVYDTSTPSGGHLLGRWKHKVSENSDYSVQLYYDCVQRDDRRFEYSSDTFDVDFHHRFRVDDRQDLVWGAGFRYVADSIDMRDQGFFDPDNRDYYLGSAFVEYHRSIVPDRLHLWLGTKLEVNSSTGLEVQPTVRGIWTPNPRNSLWAAVSRAVRTPAYFEDSGNITLTAFPTPILIPGISATTGTESFKSETLLAYELGYRWQATPRLSFDLATFYNEYDRLRSSFLDTPFVDTTSTPPRLVQPVQLENAGKAESYGGELSVNYSVTDNWRIMGSYSLLFLDAHSTNPSGNRQLEDTLEGSSPRNQFQIRTYYNLSRNLQLNGALYYVDNISHYNVPSYIRVDASLTWMIDKNCELTIGGQNVFDDRHPEFGSELFDVPTEPQHSMFAQFIWRF